MRIAEQRADAARPGARMMIATRPSSRVAQPIDQRGEAGVDRDRVGMLGKLDERAVEIEEQRGVAQQVGGGRGEVRHAARVGDRAAGVKACVVALSAPDN